MAFTSSSSISIPRATPPAVSASIASRTGHVRLRRPARRSTASLTPSSARVSMVSTSSPPTAAWRVPRSSSSHDRAASAGCGRRLRRRRCDYDFVFLDCPPSLGLLTVNGLTAADSVLIPLQCEYYALEGLSQLMATLDLVREHLNSGLVPEGCRPHDARRPHGARGRRRRPRSVPTSAITSSRPSCPAAFALPRLPASAARSPAQSVARRGAEAYRAVAAEFVLRSGEAARRRI